MPRLILAPREAVEAFEALREKQRRTVYRAEAAEAKVTALEELVALYRETVGTVEMAARLAGTVHKHDLDRLTDGAG